MPKQNKHKFKRNPDVCIFCDSTPLTDEHLFSDWTVDLLPRQQNHHYQDTDGALVFGTVPVPMERRKRPGDPASIKVKCVCSKCNSRWMSQIDNAVKPVLSPLILGKQTKLTRRDQRLIATWVTLKSIVGEYTDKKSAAVSEFHRKLFKRTQIPLGHWFIWIGHYEGQDSRRYRHVGCNVGRIEVSSNVQLLEPNLVYNNVLDTQMTSLTLGHFFAHAFSTTNAHFSKPYDCGPLLQVQPVQQLCPVDWPSKTVVTDPIADRIHSMFLEMGLKGF